MIARALARLQSAPDYAGQIVHIEMLPAREARYEALTRPLPPPLEDILQRRGVSGLYTHQACAIDAAREGENVLVATGTASGKTLCYNLPVLERILVDPMARALYLFPTKALAQDQTRALSELVAASALAGLRQGVYDGDTEPGARTAALGMPRSSLESGHAPWVILQPYWLGHLLPAPGRCRTGRGACLPGHLWLACGAADAPPAEGGSPIRRGTPVHPLLGDDCQRRCTRREAHRTTRHRGRHRWLARGPTPVCVLESAADRPSAWHTPQYKRRGRGHSRDAGARGGAQHHLCAGPQARRIDLSGAGWTGQRPGRCRPDRTLSRWLPVAERREIEAACFPANCWP